MAKDEFQESLYFFHIPKTAGTSLTEWLRRQYSDAEYCPATSIDEIERIKRGRLRRYRLFAGHLGWRLLGILDSRPVLITWLRDPVERVVSAYWYYRGLRPEQQPNLVHAASRKQAEKAVELDLEDWIELPASEYAIHNHMVWSMVRPENNPALPLGSALNNLLSFDVIGITEEMNTSLALVTDRMGWRPSILGVRRNQAARFDRSVNARLHARINQLNEMDRVLYETARRLFWERHDELVSRLGLRNAPINVPIDVRRANETPADRIDDIEVLFAQDWVRLKSPWHGERLAAGFISSSAPYFHTGWFPCVSCDHVVGNMLRWTSDPVAARVYLPLRTDGDLVVKFVVGQLTDTRILDHLAIKVNNERLDITIRSEVSPEYPDAHGIVVSVSHSILQLFPEMTKFLLFDSRVRRTSYGFRFLSLDEECPRGLALLGINVEYSHASVVERPGGVP